MAGRFFKCALILSLLFALSLSCADSDNPVGPSPVLQNPGGSTPGLSTANRALQTDEEFNCTHLEEWFVRFSDPGSVEANVATLFYNYTGAPAGTKTLEIFWDYENEPTKTESIQLGFGDVQRDNDGRSNTMGLVQHVYRNITEPTQRVVRIHFIADGKTGNCATVRRIRLTPPTGVVVGVAAPICGTMTFANSIPINILDASPASPYPSGILVSGMGGTISNVTATVYNVTHGRSFDIDILLEGPSGANVFLMNFVGDQTITPAQTYTFDDTGPNMPNTGMPVTGTYRPTSYLFFGPLPPPAPSTPPPYGFSMGAALNGTDPNGTWNLWVSDFFLFPGQTGIISGGWSLTITTTCP